MVQLGGLPTRGLPMRAWPLLSIPEGGTPTGGLPMVTNKTITIINALATSKQFAPEVVNSDVATNAVYRSMMQLDWGEVPRTQFLQPRALRDGDILRGGVWDARTFTWQLISRVATTAAAVITAGVEAVRDDEETVLNGFFLNPAGSPFKLQQSRLNTALATVTRWIRGTPTGHRSWKWAPDGVEDGFVGIHSGPLALRSIDWRCSFPWFISESSSSEVVSSSGNTLDSTNRTVTITNTGDVPCGIKITLTGTSGTGSLIVTNGYSTSSYAVPNNSIVTSSISLSATPYVIDWYGSDPEAATAVQGATDKINDIAAGSLIVMAKGSNTLNYSFTPSPTAGLIRFDLYPLWGSP